MRTAINVFFELWGLQHRDRFARHSNAIVKSEADALCQELNTLANATVEDILWEGSFPTFPGDHSNYDAFVLNELAPSTLETIAETISPVMNRLQVNLRNATQYLTNAKSMSARASSTWRYELQSRGVSVCIPVSPPPGGHICEVSVFYSSSGASTNMLEINWPIRSGDNVFSYAVHCSVRFQLEN